MGIELQNKQDIMALATENPVWNKTADKPPYDNAKVYILTPEVEIRPGRVEWIGTQLRAYDWRSKTEWLDFEYWTDALLFPLPGM